MSQDIESTPSAEELRERAHSASDAAGEDSVLSAAPSRVVRELRASIGSGGLRLGLIFVAGLIVGWLALGWWLWPVQWTNAMPWHLQPAYQERYVTLVAETFWYTKDLHQARERLSGWETEELALLLKRAQQAATTDQEHEQLVALAGALDFPTYETSLWASLREEKGIVAGAVASIALFTAAGVLGVYSLVRTEPQTAGELAVADEMLDEAAGGDQDRFSDEPGEDISDDVEEGDGLVIGAIDEDEDLDEEDEDFYDAEEDFYEEGEDLVDSLSAFMFDDDQEDISHLKDLCDRLPEVDVSVLLDEAEDVASQLRRGLELRAREPRF